MRKWKKIRYNPERRYWFIHQHYYLKNIFIVCNTRVGVSTVLKEPFVFQQYEVTISDRKTNELIGYGIGDEFQNVIREAYKREEGEYHDL